MCPVYRQVSPNDLNAKLCQGAESSPMCVPTTLRVDLNRVLEKLASSPIIRHTLSVEARDHIKLS